MAFSLLERHQLASFGDGRARTHGRWSTVEQRATIVKGSVIADLSMAVRTNAISTQIRIEPGQFLVLGQTGVSGKIPTPWQDEPEQVSLYYVIASDVEP
jgi:hypothetical protein